MLYTFLNPYFIFPYPFLSGILAFPFFGPLSLLLLESHGSLKELEFQPGQKVQVLGPPAMAGKRGDVIGTALDDAFAVRFETRREGQIPKRKVIATGEG